MEKGMALKQIAIARKKMLPAGEPDAKIFSYAKITPEQLEQIRKEENLSVH
jgi:DNA-binding transcriptional regulator YiaG